MLFIFRFSFLLFLCRTIGVVGIDATLEEIENILLNDRWGSVYAFLVNERGETIFHPLLRPSTEVSLFRDIVQALARARVGIFF